MNKTIKIIDLYNRIAVRKDIPKKIKYDGLIYNWDEDCYLHYSDGIAMEHSFLEGKKTEMLLNDEVEIIEESEQEIDIQAIEELWANRVGDSNQCRDDFMLKNRDKINELVQAVKQLDNKIKEK